MLRNPVQFTVGAAVLDTPAGALRTIESLLGQTLFTAAEHLGYEPELVVIADRSAGEVLECVTKRLEAARAALPAGSPVRLRMETAEGVDGFSAWNLLVHAFSRRGADLIYFVETGIAFDQPDALERMFHAIQKSGHMKVVSAAGRGEFAGGASGPLRRLHRRAIRLLERCQSERTGRHCFCARAAAMRSVWLPRRFPGAADDGFRQMIISDLTSRPDRPARCGTAQGASYTYPLHATLRALFAHRIRLFIGRAFSGTLLDHLRAQRAGQSGFQTVAYLRARDESDPSWLYRLVQLAIHVRGLHAVLPSCTGAFAFWSDKETPLLDRLARLPAATLIFLLDLPAFLCAAWRLKRGRMACGGAPAAAQPEGEPRREAE